MQHAESEEPEEEGVVNGEAVDDAEENFAIAEETQGRVGVVLAVDEGEAVEEQHHGGGQAVVALGDEGDAEQGTHAEGQQEVEAHLEQTLVHLEPQLVAFGLGVGHCRHGEGGEQKQSCGQDDGPADARRGVKMENVVVFWQEGQPFHATQQVAGHRRGDAGIEPDYDD